MGDHRQGLEPQQVELHQPDLLDVAHRKLRHDLVGLLRSFVEGHMGRQGIV